MDAAVAELQAENAKLREALEFYAGNFDGRDGSKWNEDMFFIETKFGTTESAEGPRIARAALGTEGKDGT